MLGHDFDVDGYCVHCGQSIWNVLLALVIIAIVVVCGIAGIGALVG